MTLYEALDRIDKIKPNTFTKTEKVAWISRLERTLYREIYDTHEGIVPPYNGYTDETDGQTVLSVPEPFDEIYLYYVFAMIDYHNREIVSYNNAMAMYNSAYSNYWAWYNRTHKPKTKRFRFFTPYHHEIRRGSFYERAKEDNVRRSYEMGVQDGIKLAEGGGDDVPTST